MIVYYTEYDSVFEDYLVPLTKERADKSKSFCLLSEKLENSNVLRCPAHLQSLNNYFAVKSIYNYTLSWDGENLFSPDYDQLFWDHNVYPRDNKKGVISFNPPRLLFFAEKSLNMELLPAFWHKNDLTKKASMVGGIFDIGKHARKIESALLMHEPCEINIERGDALYYLKFETEEKIVFKPFQMTTDINKLIDGGLASMLYNKGKPALLKYWYEKNKNFYRRRLLHLIKNNLL